jgi:site-specific DNA recombinase
LVRCAIYTRKSTEEGLDQDFNSLDAQREAGEAYIASQQHEGWRCLPDRYDDGGYSGGNVDRPALQRLLADMNAGKIDCVVVYKVDRLSRSLVDFGRLMELFEKAHVAFVSVTQQFNTSSSMGRLMLNVLLSFAQFEREIIGERTRDKMAAMRRKGMWAGGLAPLGYDIDPETSNLTINATEAKQVKAIFELYREHEALLPVVQELEQRGWTNKRTTTKRGATKGGKAFDRTSLYRLLTNVTYVGKTRYRNEIHQGEHPAILDEDLFRAVQVALHRNGATGGAKVRNNFGALLKGLLRCGACQCAMTPTHTAKGTKRYRYYACQRALKQGYAKCPAKSVAAAPIEAFVVDHIRAIGRDHELVRSVVQQARQQDDTRLAELDTERRQFERERDHANAEVKKLSSCLGDTDNGVALARLADLQQRLTHADQRLAKIHAQHDEIRAGLIHEHDVAVALRQFDEVWENLTPKEQGRLIDLLIEQVEYDATDGTVAITFHPTGIHTLATENQPETQR